MHITRLMCYKANVQYPNTYVILGPKPVHIGYLLGSVGTLCNTIDYTRPVNHY